MLQIMGRNFDVNLKDFRNKKRVELLLQQIETRDRLIRKLSNERNAIDIDLQASREVNEKLQEEIDEYKALVNELEKKQDVEVNREEPEPAQLAKEPVKRTRKKPITSKA